MQYVDKSQILRGLSKFPGVNYDGCVALYNKFYDAYLDRARLIYGDTDVIDVTPNSVISTLRSRYIGSVDQMYQGRDQFIDRAEEVVDLGISYQGVHLFAAIAPLGPRDLSFVIYGCSGDGINRNLDDIELALKVISVTILRDAVWGHTFLGSGDNLEDGFRCNTYRNVVPRVPSWNSGITEKSCAAYASIGSHARDSTIEVWFRIKERTIDTLEYWLSKNTETEWTSWVPVEVSTSRRFSFYKFDETPRYWAKNNGGVAHNIPASYRLVYGTYTVPSSYQDYNPRGNYNVVPGSNRYYTTMRDYLSLISAGFLNAII